MTFNVNSPGHVAEHNRLADLLPDGTVPVTSSGLDAATAALIPSTSGSATATQLSATIGAQAAPYDASLAAKRYFPGGLTDSRIFSVFQAGHGWTLTPTAPNTIAEDLTVPGPFSDRSIKSVIGATANGTDLKHTGLSAIDFTAGPITVWFKFAPGQASPQGFEMRVTDDTFANGYAIPVYPQTSTTVDVDGWTAMEFYPNSATNIVLGTPGTLTAIRIRGYANTTFWIGAIAQRNNSTAFPNGVITLRFDDGYASQHDLAMPLLAKYGYSGHLVFIADRLDITGGLSLAQLREMRDRAGWEIGAHAFTTADHDARFDTLTTDQVEADLRQLKQWLVSNGFDTSIWASPGGVSNESIWEVARKYFAAHWGVSGGLLDAQHSGAKNSPRPVYPAQIGSVSFDTTAATVAAMQTVIAAVKTNKSWATLTFHDIITGPSTGNQISTTDLDTILSTIQAAGIPVMTVNGVLKQVGT